jgi:CheY-like chemotaxis protein
VTPIAKLNRPLSFQYINNNFLTNNTNIINHDETTMNGKMDCNNHNNNKTFDYQDIIPLNLTSLENFNNISTNNVNNISVISKNNSYDKNEEISTDKSITPQVSLLYNNNISMDDTRLHTNLSNIHQNTNANITNINTISSSSNNNDILRVLVVDDASSNRKLLCRLLKGKYITEEAEDGLIALNMILESMKGNNTLFDVVLIDYQMPNMDGPTSVKHMRDAGYNGLIIGITGNALPADIKYFLNQGANEVLTKPVKLPQLQEIILSRKLIVSTQFII